jgi:leucine dehydrogenase
MAIFDAPDFDDHEGVHFFTEPRSGLKAIVAIHSTALGPAAGGTRYWHYASAEGALVDALRLSRAMSYKNAMAGLAAGGGKAVLLKASPGAEKSDDLLQAFGRAVDSLGGRYVTAEDVGMTESDITVVAQATRFVSGLPVAGDAASGSPAPATADGVYGGLIACVARRLGKRDASGLHVAIQGVGSVGGDLARRLAAGGARLTIADLNEARAAALAAETGARIVDVDQILRVEADVLAPCALGGVLDEDSIAGLAVPVVAGAANNQLATPEDGERLRQRGILYAPDYVINAGGIIKVMTAYLGDGGAETVTERVARIPARLTEIFDEADANGQATNIVADRIARRLIGRG